MADSTSVVPQTHPVPILQIERSLEHAKLVNFDEAVDYLATHTPAQFSSRVEIMTVLCLGDPIHTPEFIFLRPQPSWRGTGARA